MEFNNIDVKVGSAANVIKALQDYNTVILKPNIVDNRNVLTQSMINEKHTKYVIRWNYSLERCTMTVPEDCIIEFSGGTIDNGVIVGNNTRLIYSKPIDETCKAERQGTWIYDTTVADEEDITSVEGHLKFKDRPTTNGMGRKILRKHIVDGINTLTQSMINQPNTIYIIQYDYELEEDITIPENCLLEFDGGSISGAFTVTGQNTGINAGLIKIFSTNITLDGSWNVSEAYPEWFGAKGDGITDDTNTIQRTIENFVVCLLTANYKLGNTLRIEHDVILRGTKYAELLVDNTGALILNTENFIVENFKIKSSISNYTNSVIEVSRKTAPIGVNGFLTKKLIQNIVIQIPYKASYRNSVGILLCDTNNLGLYDVLVNNCYISGVDIAIKFYVNPGNVNSNVVQNCCFHANKKAVSFVRGSGGIIQDNKIVNCNFQNIDSLEYSERYNAIDIPYAQYVYNNIIDVYPWDLKCDLYTKGSLLGTIGHNVSNKKEVMGYCEAGRYGFIGTVSKGGIYGRESYTYKVTCDEGYYIISGYVKNNLSVIVENCDFYPTQEYMNLSVPDLDVYIYKGADAIYFYLRNLPSPGFRVKSTSIGTLLYTRTVKEQMLDTSLLELLTSGKRKCGSSTLRPTTPRKYFEYFDTTLNKPIYWNGTAWVDATGQTV